MQVIIVLAVPSPVFPACFSSHHRNYWVLPGQSSVTEDRAQYSSLMKVFNEKEWCRQGGEAEDYRLAAAVFQTIDEDVNRTNVRDSEERERIRRVLRAFALKNPSTGYCQVNNTPPVHQCSGVS